MPVIPVMIISAFVLLALAAGRLSPADPYAQSLRARLAPPVWAADGSWAHPLGTDRLGRDLLSRIIVVSDVEIEGLKAQALRDKNGAIDEPDFHFWAAAGAFHQRCELD